MADQLRYDCLGTGSYENTPHLDNLAAQGMSFDACYANSPVCIPSRFALATGHTASSLGIHDNIGVDLNPNLEYWTTRIRENDYQTAVIGKTHLHRHTGDLREREHLLNSYGFDYVDEIAGPRASTTVKSNMTDLWDERGYLDSYKNDFDERFANKPHVARPTVLPDDLYADNYVGTSAIRYLKSVDITKPWFCWVSFGGPHEPWDAPEEYCRQYSGQTPPSAIPFSDSEFSKIRKDTLHYRKHDQSPSLSSEEIAALRVNYAGNVSLIDNNIGKILQTLKSRRVLDNTIIVFTSDHGEMNGDHGLIYKNVLYEPAAKIPMIISLPLKFGEEYKGQRSRALIQLSDLGPTLLDLLGIPGNDSSDCAYAHSFLPLIIESDSRNMRRYAFSEVAGDTMITDGRWKMILDENRCAYMLFDLSKDPMERENLINSYSVYIIKWRMTRAANKYLNKENKIRLSQI